MAGARRRLQTGGWGGGAFPAVAALEKTRLSFEIHPSRAIGARVLCAFADVSVPLDDENHVCTLEAHLRDAVACGGAGG